ncbi:MAG: histidine kinase [Algoriphagus sp.]|uniref:sensor histidine kinase n=1 Tax=Algoriphagus sp. TaxID=1872435 RepID=UPI00271B71FB|nr:sensor histidine kinase [Algoriphagus sp.]MDO8968325.1 histidine kinase [Algoriphagus sp.]MDP2040823.1 histidine kinase [Algoriphagus sp.]MDP3200120.1 histidine kinase [Algoriphagus sp.]MDP3472370.1 histidine kinase [Algoriphagus sp.]
MLSFTPKKRLSVLVHILGWLMLCIVLLLLSPLSWRMGEIQLPIQFWWKQVFLVVLLISVFYTNASFTVPKILLQGKNYLFLLIVILGGVFFYGLIIYFEQFTLYSEKMHVVFSPDKPFDPNRKRWLPGDVFQMSLYLVSIGLSTSLALVQKWQKDETLRRELDRQRINTELSYLKAQINPHFFFNTLNNIYALTNLDVKKAQEALLKLSRMMRYVLYENQKNETLLSKEVKFIEDYIELMKMRMTEKVKLKVEIEIPKHDLIIAPMLILPFLENCFKHGVSSQHESEILIKLEVMGDTVFFETRNHIFPVNPDSPEAHENGIGLANTQRRLSLIYPDKHRLKFGKDDSKMEYWVNLTINLA